MKHTQTASFSTTNYRVAGRKGVRGRDEGEKFLFINFSQALDSWKCLQGRKKEKQRRKSWKEGTVSEIFPFSRASYEGL